MYVIFSIEHVVCNHVIKVQEQVTITCSHVVTNIPTASNINHLASYFILTEPLKCKFTIICLPRTSEQSYIMFQPYIHIYLGNTNVLKKVGGQIATLYYIILTSADVCTLY